MRLPCGMAEQSPRIAVALSGGGYRAAAFSAGALLYLIDSGVADQIVAISSVSGGSMTNAYFARNVLDAHSHSGDGPWDRVSSLLAFLARCDVISPRRMLSFASLPAATGGVVVAFVLWRQHAPGSTALLSATLTAAILLLIGAGVLYMQLRRSLELSMEWLLRLPQTSTKHRRAKSKFLVGALRFCINTLTMRLRRAISAIAPRMTSLSEIDAYYRPIFCCTDLATGSQFYISDTFVAGVAPDPNSRSSTINLGGSSPRLPIATAVAASAAFPLVFRPTVTDAKTLGLPVRRGPIDDVIVLADGGLNDNLGVSVLEAWLTGDMNSDVLGDLGAPPDSLIVVDCGQPAYQRQQRHGLIRRIVRSVDVIHQANSLVRRREVERRFRAGARSGSVISIADHPYRVATECSDSERGRSVVAWLESMPPEHRLSRNGWRTVAQQRSPDVQTNLRHLGAVTVAQLVVHGYVATMARTVTDLGWVASAPSRLPPDIESLCSKPFVGSFRDRFRWVMSGAAAQSATRQERPNEVG